MDEFVILYNDAGVAVLGTEHGKIEACLKDDLEKDPHLGSRLSDSLRAVDARTDPTGGKIQFEETSEEILLRLSRMKRLDRPLGIRVVTDPLDREHYIQAQYDSEQKLWITYFVMIIPS